MPLLNQIDSALDVIVLVLWTFALWSFTHAVFRSFLAKEIAYRMKTGAGAEKDRRMHILAWEFKHKLQWSADLESGSPHAAKRPLTAEQLAGRAQALEWLARGTLLRRAGREFATCLMCQMFWSALLAGCLFGNLSGGVCWAVVTAFCQAGLGVAISQVIGLVGPNGRRPQADGGCADGNCPGSRKG